MSDDNSRKEYINYDVKAALLSRSTNCTGAKRIRDTVVTIYEMSVELVAVRHDVTAYIVLVKVAEAVVSGHVDGEDDVVEELTLVVAAT